MNREYHRWYSSILGRDMEYTLFGHAGRPILVFPTSMGRFYQYEDFKMIDTLSWRLENGEIQLLCVDAVDTETLYNRQLPLGERARRHNIYEAYLIHELLPWFADRNWGVRDNLVVTGASFGAYHCVNFACKHPDLVRRVVAMSGAYTMPFRHDWGWDQDAYYNSPIAYLRNMHDDWYLPRIRNLDIVLAVGSDDICLDSTVELSEVLWDKGVWHHLDVWGGAWHDWPIWRDMAIKFLF